MACDVSSLPRHRIAEIELEMSRTQKNKATEYHLGQLKAKLAKLRTELQAPAKVTISTLPGLPGCRPHGDFQCAPYLESEVSGMQRSLCEYRRGSPTATG